MKKGILVASAMHRSKARKTAVTNKRFEGIDKHKQTVSDHGVKGHNEHTPAITNQGIKGVDKRKPTVPDQGIEGINEHKRRKSKKRGKRRTGEIGFL